MAKQVIRRQGSSQEHASFTGAEGEWTHDNTLNTGRFHDGVLSGGYPALLSNKINEISVSTNLDGSNFGEMIIADSTSSSFTITLPDPSVVGSGWQVAIKKSVDANSVTVSPFGGESIDGDASVILENAENAVQVRTDGTSWYALRLNNFDDAQEILYDNSTSGLSATTVQGAIDQVAAESPNDASISLSAGTGISGGGTFTTDQSTNETISFSHADTSTQGSVNNSGSTVIQDVNLDGFGHVTSLSSATINEYSDSDALDLFNVTGSAPVYACRAWVNFDGTGTVSIRDSGNVSSITDEGTGKYQINFTNSMPDTNYSVVGMNQNEGADDNQSSMGIRRLSGSLNTGSVDVVTGAIDNSNPNDANIVCVAVFR